jgi:hypothetical protein
MITPEELSRIQEENDNIKVTYFWKQIKPTDTLNPAVAVEKVSVWFKSPNVDLWKYIMTTLSDGFEIQIRGTRNQIHDSLDDCYAAVLGDVNIERAKLGLGTVSR